MEELSEDELPELPEPYLVPGIVLLDPLELLPLPVPVVLSVVLGLLGDMLPLVPEVPDVPELVSGLLGEVVLPDVLPLPMPLPMPL